MNRDQRCKVRGCNTKLSNCDGRKMVRCAKCVRLKKAWSTRVLVRSEINKNDS